VQRAHAVLLVAFAALIASLEGPAQIACALLVLTTGLVGGYRGFRPGLAELGIVIWLLAGIPGAISGLTHQIHLRSEDTLRPLHAVAFLVGSRAVARVDDRMLERMATAFLGVLALNAVYGYLQVAFGALPLDHLLLKNPNSPQIYAPGAEQVARSASGLYYNRLKLAHMGMLGLGLAGLVAFTRAPLSQHTRTLSIAAGVVIAGAMVLSYARMALLVAVIAALLVAIVLEQKRLALAAFALISLVAGALMLTRFGLSRFSSAIDDAQIRIHMFGTAFGLFRDHPVLGIGHGLYRPTIAPTWDGQGALMDAHNLPLQLLAETGVIGFIGFALCIGVCTLRVIRAVRRDRALSSSDAVRDRFALYGVLSLSILGLTHVPMHHAPVAMAFWCLLGIAASTDRARP
jgi:O-antigen ligase